MTLMQSIFNMIPAEDQKVLPEDENSPEKRADKIWQFFGKKENGNNSLAHFNSFCYTMKHIHVLLLFYLYCFSSFSR